MPLYEYYCLDCKQKFDVLRRMKDADEPICCENCHGEHTSRTLTVFNAHSGGRAVAGASSSAGCASCAGGSCASCGH